MEKNNKEEEKTTFDIKNCGTNCINLKNKILYIFDKYICKCCIFVNHNKKEQVL